MASLSVKDRVSLCQFSFADGRRCRTPRTGKNPHFCFDHAQKEARALAEESLSKDLAYFFSGDYLSACDLSTAMGRLIPAVIRGDIKPRAARTVAYMAQTLLQTIHLAQHEYTNTFGSTGWRNSIRDSVNGNHSYRFPQAQRSGGLQAGPVPQPVPPSAPQSQPPAPTLNVVAGLQTGEVQSPQPAAPAPVCHPERSEGSQPVPAPQPAQAANCHSERSEEPASSSNSSPATHHSFTSSESEGPLPETPTTPSLQSNNQPQERTSTPSLTPNKDAWQQFDRTHRHLP